MRLQLLNNIEKTSEKLMKAQEESIKYYNQKEELVMDFLQQYIPNAKFYDVKFIGNSRLLCVAGHYNEQAEQGYIKLKKCLGCWGFIDNKQNGFFEFELHLKDSIDKFKK